MNEAIYRGPRVGPFIDLLIDLDGGNVPLSATANHSAVFPYGWGKSYLGPVPVLSTTATDCSLGWDGPITSQSQTRPEFNW